MSVVVVATFHPTPGKLDELAEAVTSIIPSVHDEEGCELYSLNRGEDRLIMIEKWTSRELLAIHGRSSPGLAELRPRLKGLVAGPPEVFFLDAIPAGGDKGEL